MADRLSVFQTPFGSPEQVESIDLRLRVLRIPLGLGFTKEELAAEDGQVHIVALSGKDLVGCLLLRERDSFTAKMRQVAVEPSMQGKGIGRAMVEFSEEVAKRRGWNRIDLNSRDTAVDFYLRLGYERVGEPFTEVSLWHQKMAKNLKY